MKHDPKYLIEKGYDSIASRYLEWSPPSPARMSYLQKLVERLPVQAQVLELGCGAGVPCTQLLAQHAHVTGIDLSAAQIALANQHVPNATLFQSDMMSLMFSPATFDAIAAFYSIIHLPRAEQPVLMKRLAEWLRPGGYLLVNLGTANDPGSIELNWLGTAMYWSSYDTQTNREMIQQAGFTLIEAEILHDNEDGELVAFLWILAKKEDEAKKKFSVDA